MFNVHDANVQVRQQNQVLALVFLCAISVIAAGVGDLLGRGWGLLSFGILMLFGCVFGVWASIAAAIKHEPVEPVPMPQDRVLSPPPPPPPTRTAIALAAAYKDYGTSIAKADHLLGDE